MLIPTLGVGIIGIGKVGVCVGTGIWVGATVGCLDGIDGSSDEATDDALPKELLCLVVFVIDLPICILDDGEGALEGPPCVICVCLGEDITTPGNCPKFAGFGNGAFNFDKIKSVVINPTPIKPNNTVSI
jgi:hypothetical protein